MRLAINGRFHTAAVSGVQRFAREVTRRLCEQTDVTLLLPRTADRAASPAASATVRGRWQGHVFEQWEAPRLARTAGCAPTLHLSGTLPVRGGPHVSVLHDVLPLTNPEWFSWRFAHWYRFILRAAAPRAAAVITVSEWSKTEIIRVLGLHRDRVFVVQQGVGPFDGPADSMSVRSVRERFALPDRFVLALGAGDPRKNLGFLAGVWTAWRAHWGDPPVLVTVGEALTRVHGRIRGPRAEGLWLGRVSDEELRALYTAASVVCFPSLAEGFGRPPLEAAACGTPTLAAAYASAAETLKGTAMLLPLDAVRWAEGLHTLLHDRAAGTALLEQSRGVLTQSSWDACAARILDICRDVADRAGTPGGHGARRLSPLPG